MLLASHRQIRFTLTRSRSSTRREDSERFRCPRGTREQGGPRRRGALLVRGIPATINSTCSSNGERAEKVTNVERAATGRPEEWPADHLNQRAGQFRARAASTSAMTGTTSYQVPITPPSSLVITTVAERGRPPAASGHWLNASGAAAMYSSIDTPVGRTGRFGWLPTSPGCWTLTNIVLRSGV